MEGKYGERFFESRVSRRQFLRRSAGGVLALSAMGTLLAACGGGDGDGDGGETAAGGGGTGGGGAAATVKWVSPRATLDVMDDYNLWVPIKMGYYDELGINAELNAGPGEGEMQLIAEGQLDMGYPSPGILTSAIDAGVPVKSIWEQYPAQVFDFSLPEDSDITEITDLEGKTVSVLTVGWKPIIDPLLVQAGVDPASVKLVETGAQWSQAVAQGQADAGLAWEGLRAQLLGQGLKLKFLLGSDFSPGPSNVYAVRAADLEDDAKVDAYTRFLSGAVMGFEFCRANPRAAAQITFNELPALKETLSPQLALDSMLQLAVGYGQEERAGNGWGFHNVGAWEDYLGAILELGQIKKELTIDQVLTNDFVEGANDGADKDKARADAEAFELDEAFAATTVPDGIEL